MNSIACPLCGDNVLIRTTKKKKPYVRGDECGYQWFFRNPSGINRLEKFSNRNTLQLEDYVVCKDCQIAIRKILEKIEDPLFRKAGIYCPGCEELLLEAPKDWKERMERN